ncbi:MAG: class I SAM-dependent methyltransferase [Luteolibacter sp.]
MSFDRLAPFYRAMEFFTAGGKLQRCRTVLLGKIPVPGKILLAGEGHGRTLRAVLEKFPDAEIVVVDSSAGMLKVARGNVPAGARVDFVLADLLTWEGRRGDFDLIVTNFFLDCFAEDQLALVVSNLAKMAAPQADWLLADFQVAEGRVASLRSKVILGLLYAFFRAVCGLEATKLHPPDAALAQVGFSRQHRVLSDWGLLKSEWWAREQAK